MSAEALAALFGRVFNRGTELELSGGLNFKRGISAELNAAEKRIDVYLTGDPETFVTSVTTYGADPAASAAVNTAAIQDAIDAAEAEGGGVVLIPVGTYSTNAPLVVDSPNVLILAQPGAVLLLTDLDAAGIEISADNCGVENLRIVTDGTGVSGNEHFDLSGDRNYLIRCESSGAYRGVQCTGTNTRILDCEIDGAIQAAIFFTTGATDCLIRDCVVSNATADGVYVITGTRVTVEGCKFDTVTGNAILFNAGSGHAERDNVFTSVSGADVSVQLLATDTRTDTMSSTPSVTIASGAISYTDLRKVGPVPTAVLSTEASASYDTLDTISGGVRGAVLILRKTGADDVNIAHGAGNIQLADGIDFNLVDSDDYLVLAFSGTNWVEISRSVGSAEVNSQSGTSYTLSLEDCNRQAGVESTGASAFALTIDLYGNTPYPVGAKVPLTQIGTGAVSVTAGAGVTINGATGASVVTLDGQYSSAILWHRSINDWIVITGGAS